MSVKFGDRMMQARKEKGLSREELAEKIGTSGPVTVLVRTLGHLQEVSEVYRQELRNPFKWLQYGVRAILSLPVQLLNWLGIISDATMNRITSNAAFKVVSGIVGLVSFASSIIGLIGGWQPFIETLHKWFPAVFK